jgi:phosphotriesterase-related protein
MAHHLRSAAFTRRQVIRLLSAGAGLRVVRGLGGEAVVAAGAAPQAAAAARAPQIPRGAIIRTLLKDVEPTSITGSIMMHEHPGSGQPRESQATSDPAKTDSLDWMVEEMKAAAGHGVACMVAAQTGLPTAPVHAGLKQLSERSGMQIVMAGGYYWGENYPPDIKTRTEDEIAAGLVRTAGEFGMGAFGEIGVSNGEADLSPDEKKGFRAVGKAHLRTGLPIITHNNYGTGPDVPKDISLRQLDLFEAVGVKPQSVALGHLCCLNDPKAEIAQRGARRGAFIAFDRLTRHHQWVSDEQRVVMILAFLDAGYVDQLLFADDWSGRPSTARGESASFPGSGLVAAHDGGPGWARTAVWFLPLLRKAGVGEDTLRRILVDNPRRLLAFVPKTA